MFTSTDKVVMTTLNSWNIARNIIARIMIGRNMIASRGVGLMYENNNYVIIIFFINFLIRGYDLIINQCINIFDRIFRKNPPRTLPSSTLSKMHPPPRPSSTLSKDQMVCDICLKRLRTLNSLLISCHFQYKHRPPGEV